jgi:DNA-binding transcriptional MerR regulator
MRIGELARRTAVSERSLRYYEARGLLAARRTAGGQRDFPEGSVDRVVLIQYLFAAGLCSSKVAELLPCLRDEDAGPAADATGWLATQLQAQRDRIDEQIAALHRSREVLDEIVAAAQAAAGRTDPVGVEA